ncbi:MAG: HAD-IB family phosphatase [candidate division Zixibacteria bacterium]|nr:HAD-IB family phosphatase [candidate division Zixibacteria bacterium]
MKASNNYSKVRSIVIDFDSTICAVESMDILFEEIFREETEREKILHDVKRITRIGMEGNMPFDESLKKRVDLIPSKLIPIERIVSRLKERLSLSFKKFISRVDISCVNVVSSGFRQLIEPCLTPLGIPKQRIHCNRLILNSAGVFQGVDFDHALAKCDGKERVVTELGLEREIVMIGDGSTDARGAQSGVADYFFGYAEFVRRENVLSQANETLTSFDDLDNLLNFDSLKNTKAN